MKQKQPGPKKIRKEATTAEQKKQEQEVKRQRELVKTFVYPYLLANSKSVADAKRLCYETGQVLSQSFQKQVLDYQRKLSDSETTALVFEDIVKNPERFKLIKGFLDLFKKETTTTANALVTGMQTAIESFVNEEISKRELSTLNTTFL